MNEMICLLNLAQFKKISIAKKRAKKIITSHLTPNTRNRSEWGVFLDLMELNAVLPLTFKNLNELGVSLEDLPLNAREKKRWNALQNKSKKQEESGQEQYTWALKILSAIADAGIEVILLKGGLLGSTLYGDPAYKKMNDIDILIRFEQAEKSVQILRSLGLSSIGNLFGKEEISSKSHHAPPYVSPDAQCVIGIHWGLHSKYAQWKSDIEDIWKQKQPVCLATKRGPKQICWRMSWEDNLLHLCTHLPFFKIGLRELSDVYNTVIFAQPKIDWSKFSIRVHEWNAEDAAYRVLSLAQALMPFDLLQTQDPTLDSLLTHWRSRASRLCIQDTDKRTSSPELLLRSRSTQISKIEKAFTVFRLTKRYPEKVKAWAGTWYFTFWPSYTEHLRITGNLKLNSPLHHLQTRITAPGLILSALARDYGKSGLLAITLLNIGVVLKETAQLSFLKNEEGISSHPASRLMENVE